MEYLGKHVSQQDIEKEELSLEFFEGEDAFLSGISMLDNPYDKFSIRAKRWFMGYTYRKDYYESYEED